MFGKLLAIILTFGAIGCILLVNRQQRIEAVHEMAQLHRQIQNHERMLWRVRGDIALRCSPDQLRTAIETLEGDWLPFAIEQSRQRREVERLMAEQREQLTSQERGG